MIRSGEHVLWDAHLQRAQLRALVQSTVCSMEALTGIFEQFERSVRRAAEQWARAWAPLVRALSELEGRS